MSEQAPMGGDLMTKPDPGTGGPLTDLGIVVLAALVAWAVAFVLTWAVLS